MNKKIIFAVLGILIGAQTQPMDSKYFNRSNKELMTLAIKLIAPIALSCVIDKITNSCIQAGYDEENLKYDQNQEPWRVNNQYPTQNYNLNQYNWVKNYKEKARTAKIIAPTALGIFLDLCLPKYSSSDCLSSATGCVLAVYNLFNKA